MRIAEVVWGDWNREHITGHGGSVIMAEAVLQDPEVRIQVTRPRTAKAQAFVVTRDWTVVFIFEAIEARDAVRAYPITMYPTRRGGRTTRRQP